MNHSACHYAHADREAFLHSLHSLALVAAMVWMQGIALAQAVNLTDPSPALEGAANTKPAQTVSVESAHKTLRQVMQEIKARSGADIKLPSSLANDPISRSVQDGNWQAAIKRLLVGYNYSATWGKDGQPRELTVYGRNQNAEETVVAEAKTAPTGSGEELLVYETASTDLPQKLPGLNPGAVSSVSLPVERMKEMVTGEKVSLNLPCGQFAVIHDKRFQHPNGDVTWIGHLESAGNAYSIIVTLSNGGAYGQVMTPEGMYNLDLEQGRTWLVDVNDGNSNAQKQNS